MLTPSHMLTQLTEQYGPHLHDTPPDGRGVEADRLVKDALLLLRCSVVSSSR
jgi:hypothetical protein